VAGIESGARDAVPTSRTYDVSAPLELMEDPVAQWLDWEQQANLVGFRTSTQPVEVEVVSVPRDEVEVHVLAGAPQAIIDRFVGADSLRFPRHPLNRDSGVAWFDAPVAERWTARFTASRTLAMPGPESGDALFSLKLSTDHPHPDFHQPEKTKLREEVVGALLWVSLVDRIDAMLPPLEVAKLVREVLLVLAKGGETGFRTEAITCPRSPCRGWAARSPPSTAPPSRASGGAASPLRWAAPRPSCSRATASGSRRPTRRTS
jgi:hypothetical protein